MTALVLGPSPTHGVAQGPIMCSILFLVFIKGLVCDSMGLVGGLQQPCRSLVAMWQTWRSSRPCGDGGAAGMPQRTAAAAARWWPALNGTGPAPGALVVTGHRHHRAGRWTTEPDRQSDLLIPTKRRSHRSHPIESARRWLLS